MAEMDTVREEAWAFRSKWNPLGVKYGVLVIENGSISFIEKNLLKPLAGKNYRETIFSFPLKKAKVVPQMGLQLGVRMTVSSDDVRYYVTFVDPNTRSASGFLKVPKAREIVRRCVELAERARQNVPTK
jgi:hypothetical protein